MMPPDFVQAAQVLLQDEALREKFGENARKYRGNFF